MDAGAAGMSTRRVLRGAGLLLLTAGLGVLGYVGWQLFGTTYLAQREHESLRTAITQEWEVTHDSDETHSTPSGEGLLRVPRFGADYEMPILNGFDDATLTRGVGRLPEGAQAGEVGNLVLAGHRITHGEPFRGFLDLRAGDEVVVETRKAVYTYVLREDGNQVQVDFSTTWPLQAVPEPGAEGQRPNERLITLVTCSELFHTDDRSVVIGELVDMETKS